MWEILAPITRNNPGNPSSDNLRNNKGQEEGRAEGDAKGYERGRREALAASVHAVLRSRGIEAALDSPQDRVLFGAVPAEVLVAEALACTGEADFRRRVRARLDPPRGLPP